MLLELFFSKFKRISWNVTFGFNFNTFVLLFLWILNYIFNYFTFSPTFPLFSGNVTLTLYVENNILWKKKYFQPFSRHFNCSTISPTFSLLTFFLKCIMKKIYFLFSTQHQNSSVTPFSVLDFIFNALPFFLNTELQLLFPTFSLFEKKVQKLYIRVGNSILRKKRQNVEKIAKF